MYINRINKIIFFFFLFSFTTNEKSRRNSNNVALSTGFCLRRFFQILDRSFDISFCVCEYRLLSSFLHPEGGNQQFRVMRRYTQNVSRARHNIIIIYNNI